MPARAAEIGDVEPLEAIEVGSIAGRITAGDGEELDYGLVEVYDVETDMFVRYTSIDRDGKYKVGNLDPGQYDVLLSNSDDRWTYDYFPQWFDDVCSSSSSGPPRSRSSAANHDWYRRHADAVL